MAGPLSVRGFSTPLLGSGNTNTGALSAVMDTEIADVHAMPEGDISDYDCYSVPGVLRFLFDMTLSALAMATCRRRQQSFDEDHNITVDNVATEQEFTRAGVNSREPRGRPMAPNCHPSITQKPLRRSAPSASAGNLPLMQKVVPSNNNDIALKLTSVAKEDRKVSSTSTATTDTDDSTPLETQRDRANSAFSTTSPLMRVPQVCRVQASQQQRTSPSAESITSLSQSEASLNQPQMGSQAVYLIKESQGPQAGTANLVSTTIAVETKQVLKSPRPASQGTDSTSLQGAKSKGSASIRAEKVAQQSLQSADRAASTKVSAGPSSTVELPQQTPPARSSEGSLHLRSMSTPQGCLGAAQSTVPIASSPAAPAVSKEASHSYKKLSTQTPSNANNAPSHFSMKPLAASVAAPLSATATTKTTPPTAAALLALHGVTTPLSMSTMTSTAAASVLRLRSAKQRFGSAKSDYCGSDVSLGRRAPPSIAATGYNGIFHRRSAAKHLRNESSAKEELSRSVGLRSDLISVLGGGAEPLKNKGAPSSIMSCGSARRSAVDLVHRVWRPLGAAAQDVIVREWERKEELEREEMMRDAAQEMMSVNLSPDDSACDAFPLSAPLDEPLLHSAPSPIQMDLD